MRPIQPLVKGERLVRYEVSTVMLKVLLSFSCFFCIWTWSARWRKCQRKQWEQAQLHDAVGGKSIVTLIRTDTWSWPKGRECSAKSKFFQRRFFNCKNWLGHAFIGDDEVQQLFLLLWQVANIWFRTWGLWKMATSTLVSLAAFGKLCLTHHHPCDPSFCLFFSAGPAALDWQMLESKMPDEKYCHGSPLSTNCAIEFLMLDVLAVG